MFADLRIAYLSGRSHSQSFGFGLYSEDDIDALRMLSEEKEIVDILLTYPCNLISTYFSVMID